MLDFQNHTVTHRFTNKEQRFDLHQLSVAYPLSKRLFDWVVAGVLLIPLVMVACLLALLNPFLNAVPLLFCQQRMGYENQPFTAYKFRSMRVADPGLRGAFDALETSRITWLGRVMRRLRLDELPQIINVFRGEMSMIGPRPDSYAHACVYVREIPGYKERHAVMPGISGLAQTQIGYVDGLAGIQRKVAADMYYINHVSFGFDLWIAWRTICVVLGCRGA